MQHLFSDFKHKIGPKLKTRIDVSTNSADLERAPGARSVGEEFVETSILVTELQWCENMGFHFHASPFGTRSLLCTDPALV